MSTTTIRPAMAPVHTETVTENAQEMALLLHVRGHAHYGPDCRLCAQDAFNYRISTELREWKRAGSAIVALATS